MQITATKAFSVLDYYFCNPRLNYPLSCLSVVIETSKPYFSAPYRSNVNYCKQIMSMKVYNAKFLISRPLWTVLRKSNKYYLVKNLKCRTPATMNPNCTMNNTSISLGIVVLLESQLSIRATLRVAKCTVANIPANINNLKPF